MRFSLKTDYGLRILIFMQKENDKILKGGTKKIITAGDLSEALKISYLYLMKFMKVLRSAGLIYSIQGSKGGFVLCKTGEEISVYDVVEAVEGKFEIFSCCYRHGNAKNIEECPYDKKEQCGVYIMLRAAEEELARNMKAISIADLCRMEKKADGERRPYDPARLRVADL